MIFLNIGNKTSIKVVHITTIFTVTLLCMMSQHTYASDSNWYAGGALGYTDYQNKNIDKDLADKGITTTSLLHDETIPWHFFVGYQHNQHLAFEGGYQYLDKQVGTSKVATQPGLTAESSRETDGFLISAKGILPLSRNYSLQASGGYYLWHVVTGISSQNTGSTISRHFENRELELFYGIELHRALDKKTTVFIQWLGLNIDNKNADLFNIGLSHQFSLSED